MRYLRVVLGISVMSSSAVGQSVWQERSFLEEYPTASMVFDSARQQVLLLTARQSVLCVLSATGWKEMTTIGQRPPARGAGGICFDTKRQVVVLFGGAALGGTFLNDIWEWNGSTWTQKFPQGPSPIPRRNPNLVYDEARQRVVTYGGMDALYAPLGDTWEYDGQRWTNAVPPVSPGPKHGHSMWYDPGRQRTALYGGQGTTAIWEWDGAVWSSRQPALSPSARYESACAFDFDRGRMILFGGDSFGPTSDTWEFDGSSWIQLNPAHSPEARMGGRLVYDQNGKRALLFGGQSREDHINDLWEWEGGDWKRISESATPRIGNEFQFVYDVARKRLVLHGHVNGDASTSTWEFDGAIWSRRELLNKPPRLTEFCLAYDSARQVVLLFGGAGSNGVSDDLWEYDGTSWIKRTLTGKPAPRTRAACAYDTKRGKFVVFGGGDNVTTYADMWEFDGMQWKNVTVSPGPTGRQWASMTYDSRRGRAVMFGGSSATAVNDETWEWDGSAWALRLPGVRPMGRTYARMVYDVARDRCVLSTGSASDGFMWEWNGNAWNQLSSPNIATQRNIIAYDLHRSVVAMLTNNRGVNRSEMWELLSQSPADRTRMGVGCATSSGIMDLDSVDQQLPWLGDAFGLRATRLPLTGATTVIIGSSNESWGPLRLPYDLSAIAMPGCFLYASGDVAVPVFNLGGSATLALPLCQCLELVGVKMHTQAFVVDVAANVRGWAASNGVSLRIGSR